MTSKCNWLILSQNEATHLRLASRCLLGPIRPSFFSRCLPFFQLAQSECKRSPIKWNKTKRGKLILQDTSSCVFLFLKVSRFFIKPISGLTTCIKVNIKPPCLLMWHHSRCCKNKFCQAKIDNLHSPSIQVFALHYRIIYRSVRWWRQRRTLHFGAVWEVRLPALVPPFWGMESYPLPREHDNYPHEPT